MSRNTDYKYIKDGTASMKIEGTVIGKHQYAFVSNFLSLGDIRGKHIAEIAGFTPKTFGFWVYSDRATGIFMERRRINEVMQ